MWSWEGQFQNHTRGTRGQGPRFIIITIRRRMQQQQHAGYKYPRASAGTSTKDQRDSRSYSSPPRGPRRSSSQDRGPLRRSPTVRRTRSESSSGAGLEITYWDSRRRVTVRIQLTRFRILCVLVVILASLTSLSSREVNASELLSFLSFWFRT